MTVADTLLITKLPLLPDLFAPLIVIVSPTSKPSAPQSPWVRVIVGQLMAHPTSGAPLLNATVVACGTPGILARKARLMDADTGGAGARAPEGPSSDHGPCRQPADPLWPA